jgi:hypothetical protein
MDISRSRNEKILYWLAFLLALGIRFYQLGAGALSDFEAQWALQALGLAQGSPVILGPHPAYLLLTSQLFSILGNTNFMARLLPALAGSLLAWLPYFFRRWMGGFRWMHWAGVIMAFGLAIDPGLVSLSRQAGSLMPALAFTLIALACLYNRRMIWLGIFSGLALLSGPAFLQGLLILAVTWGLISLISRNSHVSPQDETHTETMNTPLPAASIWTGAIAFLLTLLAVGTLFLRIPQGLGALADSLSAYLRSWVTSSGIPLLRLPGAVLVYQTMVLILAIVCAVRGWLTFKDQPRQRQLVIGLSVWAVVAFFIPWIYVGRQVGDMAWSLIPIWALAAIEISRSFATTEERNTRLVGGGLGLLLCLFMVIAWFNLLSVGRYQANLVLYWGVIVGAFLLGILAVFLVMAGWSGKAARMGVVGALSVVMGLQLVSSTWGIAILRQNSVQDLWSIPPSTGQVDLLVNTLSDVSIWHTGLNNQLKVVVMVDSPALNWALRNDPYAVFETAMASSETPPAVITLKGADEPLLQQQYRGEDFVWRLSPGWDGIFPPNFINWLAFRKAPLDQDQVILWVRQDIFPGGVSSSAGNVGP